MAIPFSKNINNLNNDYPKLLDQVISQSQILRCGNSRVMPYCRNRSLSIKISLNKKELNFQYLTCNISDGSNFKFRLLNCQMPVVTEYEAVKMSKEFGQKELEAFDTKARELMAEDFAKKDNEEYDAKCRDFLVKQFEIDPAQINQALSEINTSVFDAMAYGIGAIETNDGSVKSVELEAATDMAKILTEDKSILL